MQERYLNHGNQLTFARIIGFIDDNVSLRKQYVYGKVVLGGVTDLQALIEKYHIDQIVLTGDITDNNNTLLKKIAVDNGVKLKRWQTCTVDI